MHRFIKSMTTREILAEQVPAMTLSMLIAEMFYKFHSFTLECLAFLGTWYLLDLLIRLVFKLILRKQTRLDQASKQDNELGQVGRASTLSNWHCK